MAHRTVATRRSVVLLSVVAMVLTACGVQEPSGPPSSASPSDPVASPSPAATPSPVPTPVPASITWSRLPLAPALFDGAAVGLVVDGPLGLLAFGQQTDTLQPITWTSVDGVEWIRHDLDPAVFGGGVPDEATAGGLGWIALGYRSSYEGLRREIWTSADGVTWTRDPDPSGRRAIRSFARVGSIVIGVLEGVDGSTSLVRSTDGLRWTDIRHPDVPNGVTLLGAGLGYFHAVDLVGGGTLWRSADGIFWSPVPRPDGVSLDGVFDESGDPYAGGSWVVEPIDFVEADDGLIIVWEGQSECCSFPLQWHSADGRTWTQSMPWWAHFPNAVASFARLAVIGGRALVQFRDESDEPPDPQAAPSEAFQAETALGSWQDVAAPDVDLRLAADHDGSVVVPAWDTTLQHWVVWRGVLDGAAATAGATDAGAAGSAASPVGAASASTGADASDALVIAPVNGHGPFGSLVEMVAMQAVAAVPGGRFVMIGQTSDGLVAWVSATGRRWSQARTLAGSGSECGLPLSCSVILGAGRRGFVVVAGSRGWFSRDGLTWLSLTTAAFRDGTPQAIVAGPTGFVGVGSVCRRDRCRAAAWTSSDGRRWRLHLGVEAGAAAVMVSVTRSPTGFIAGGSREVLAPNAGPDEEATVTVPRLWSSSDGARWTLVRDLPVAGDHGAVRAVASRGAGGRAPLVALVESGRVLVSLDGRKWAAVDVPDGLESRSLVSVAGRFLAVAGDRAWTSTDGRSWAALALPANGPWLSEAASRGDIAVVLGRSVSNRWVSTWLAGAPGARLPTVLCPPARPTALQYLALSARDRVACYGGRTVTISANLNVSRGCGGGCGDDPEDDWWSYPEIMLSVSARGPTLATAATRGTTRDRLLRMLTDDPRGRQLTVSVRTDDPSCRRPPAITPDAVRYEPIAQQVMNCRQAMMIVGVRR